MKIYHITPKYRVSDFSDNYDGYAVVAENEEQAINLMPCGRDIHCKDCEFFHGKKLIEWADKNIAINELRTDSVCWIPDKRFLNCMEIGIANENAKIGVIQAGYQGG